jgi:hypothetical protein
MAMAMAMATAMVLFFSLPLSRPAIEGHPVLSVLIMPFPMLGACLENV